MQGIVSTGPRTVAVQDMEDARIEQPTDILLRLTSTALCGTDLHIYEGRLGDFTGNLIGHEPLGVVEEVGAAVVSVRKGDRVVLHHYLIKSYAGCQAVFVGFGSCGRRLRKGVILQSCGQRGAP